jgi:hypothetical protein
VLVTRAVHAHERLLFRIRQEEQQKETLDERRSARLYRDDYGRETSARDIIPVSASGRSKMRASDIEIIGCAVQP